MQLKSGKFEEGDNTYIDALEWKKGISKDIPDILEGARSGKTKKKHNKHVTTSASEFKPIKEFKTQEEISKEIIRMEDLMHKHAQSLEFEEAAAHRDRISELKKVLFFK